MDRRPNFLCDLTKPPFQFQWYFQDQINKILMLNILPAVPFFLFSPSRRVVGLVANRKQKIGWSIVHTKTRWRKIEPLLFGKRLWKRNFYLQLRDMIITGTSSRCHMNSTPTTETRYMLDRDFAFFQDLKRAKNTKEKLQEITITHCMHLPRSTAVA